MIKLAIAISLTFASTAWADTCDLTGMTLTAGTQSCAPGLPPGHDTCRLMKTRTQFLKDKIYWYDSVDSQAGTIFYPGQTVDALTAPEENRALYDQYRNNPRVRALQASIPLTVTMTHDTVRLDYSIRTHQDPRFPDDWTGTGWWITFRMPDCYSCVVEDYAEYDHTAGRGDNVTQKLTRGSCQIDR